VKDVRLKGQARKRDGSEDTEWRQRSANKIFLQGILDERRGGSKDSRRSVEYTSPLKHGPLDQMDRNTHEACRDKTGARHY